MPPERQIPHRRWIGWSAVPAVVIENLNDYCIVQKPASSWTISSILMQKQISDADVRPKGSVELRLLWRLLDGKLRDRGTYIVAAIVGTLINAYGQLLVPWFRGVSDPLLAFASEFQTRPGLTAFSVFIAYAFPFCVGIYSAVAARYHLRRIESVADFPDRKPDPVFRATRSGRLVEVGAKTRELFERHRVEKAQQILGDEVWQKIVGSAGLDAGTRIYYAAEDVEYFVAHVPTDNGEFNVYLTRLPRLG